MPTSYQDFYSVQYSVVCHRKADLSRIVQFQDMVRSTRVSGSKPPSLEFLTKWLESGAQVLPADRVASNRTESNPLH